MKNSIAYLAAVSALALPAGMALAQSAAPGGAAPRPGTGAATSTPARNTPRATQNNATEDAQGSAPAAEAPQQAAQAPADANAQAAPPPTPPAAPSVRAATAADLRAGAQVVDTTGAVVGTVESADANGAVVSTGTVRARVPLASFASNGTGLVISMNRAQFEAAARSAAAHPTAG